MTTSHQKTSQNPFSSIGEMAQETYELFANVYAPLKLSIGSRNQQIMMSYFYTP